MAVASWAVAAVAGCGGGSGGGSSASPARTDAAPGGALAADPAFRPPAGVTTTGTARAVTRAWRQEGPTPAGGVASEARYGADGEIVEILEFGANGNVVRSTLAAPHPADRLVRIEFTDTGDPVRPYEERYVHRSGASRTLVFGPDGRIQDVR